MDADSNNPGAERDIRALIAAAQEHLSKKNYARAQQACRKVLVHDPTHRVALYLSALCELYRDRLDKVVAALSTLVEHHPGHVNGLVLLSKVHLRMGEHRQSAHYARRALQTDIRDERVLALLAQILGESEDHQSAKAAYERALRINPGNATHLCNYASILRIEGRIDEAVDALERCIELEKINCKAHWMLSSLKRQTPADNHVARLVRLHATPNISHRNRMLISFALAKEYEDLGEYEKAFRFLSEACGLKRSSIQYDVESDIRQLRRLHDLFEPSYVSRMSGSGYSDYSPLFILGLPRTGSTLIEQILGAHERVFAAGELPTLGNEIDRLFARNADAYPAFSSAAAAEIDYRALGRRYVEASLDFIESAKHKTGFNSSMKFVDKMPQNFMYVGFILLALPQAKVIVTQRNAMDTCLSNFKQLYNDPFYRFSYKLDEMASYFIAYSRLMQHWKRLFGERILTVKYEEFVTRPEPNAQRIFEYCGLAWSRKYLEPVGRNGFIATASATQVREAINARSVGRWRQYTQQLSPILTQLRRAGLEIA